MLGPVVVAATLLARRLMIGLIGVAVLCLSGLALVHQPLPWPPPGFVVPPLYLQGLWLALVFSIFFIGFYVSLIQQENRRMTEALGITSMALERAQRMSALGALAAAAAHELGSPLSTIRLVATEMARGLPADHPFAEDIGLLVSETARCRDILAELSRQPEQNDTPLPFDMLPLDQIVQRAIKPYLTPMIRLHVRHQSDHPLPVLRFTPELQHGLGNLLQNACQFADEEITITLDANTEQVTITITDDGPGFSPGILHRLGEPYLSVHPESHPGGNNLGLGIFIAFTLLEKIGARVTFHQAEGKGATQIITWPRPMPGDLLPSPRHHEGKS